MTCVEIKGVKTNLDSYKSVQKKPAKCLYVDGAKDACKYTYDDSTGTEKTL